VSGIAVNSNGHVFVLSRGKSTGPAYAAAAAQLLEFDADGNFLREIGHNLYAWSFAHMVKVDRHDNIWVTDKGSDMVIKFTPAGRVAMVFGRKQEASDEETGPLKHPNPPLAAEPGRFRQVTDVAFDSADNTGPNQVLYSADAWPGRIYKLTLDGQVLGVLGESGKQLKQFGWIHQIACPSENVLWVGELLNWRAQKLVLRQDWRPRRCWRLASIVVWRPPCPLQQRHCA
jgi:hypothetical protein